MVLEDGFIQVAGVIDFAEAKMLQDCGVRYIGFPLRLPVHREDLSERDAASIIKSLAPTVNGVLITYLDSATEIADFCHTLGVRIVQLHGAIQRDELEHLKALDPSLIVIKSLVVGLYDKRTLESMVVELFPLVDAFITDTYDPTTGASGATGKIHDWTVSRGLVELSERPVILGGGLTAENVRQAILAVRPAGVDSHTGVEDATGRKSRDKVKKFLSQAREGFRLLRRT